MIAGHPTPPFIHHLHCLSLAGLLGLGAANGLAQTYDPLALASALAGVLENPEAPIIPQCYTKTGGIPNPCWTCHTHSQGTNYRDDAYP